MGRMGASGGLTKSKLEQATAAPADVVAGKTYYAGDKLLKTGTLAERGAQTSPVSVGNDGGNLYARIPVGAYRQLAGTGYPEIKIANADAISNLPGGNRGDWGATINQGGSVTIPQGWHSGGGVVRANGVTPGCERAGACWANGYANGSGWQGSSYCGGGNNTYDAWVTAAVSGYFCVWTVSGGGTAPANYWFGWANAGQELARRTSGSTGTMMVAYIHI